MQENRNADNTQEYIWACRVLLDVSLGYENLLGRAKFELFTIILMFYSTRSDVSRDDGLANFRSHTMGKVIEAVAWGLAATFLTSNLAIAATCGHDVHGSPTIEVTELGENSSVLHYFSPATLVMDDKSHPAHRAFGECRGQGVTIDGVSKWSGSCIWKDSDGDAMVAHWSSSPGDKGTEEGGLHGIATWIGSGKLAKFGGSVSWTGLANGGSYLCVE